MSSTTGLLHFEEKEALHGRVTCVPWVKDNCLMALSMLAFFALAGDAHD
ncbi:hypothetical protein V2P20_11335 [Methylobacter sp. Wu1]